ncbi:DUF6806 family protein [Burkholderia sp. MBR-1]|uniref:DUF6806 family protein n=1 Tax=Burkholderia sp. MBR-1 TaxID=2732364 RepID=UPI0015EF72BE|nr:DUF6806 family protein [Burkholderia sp. MBR-1]QMI49909.1 hypothetical protein MBR110_31105 [Burkholderia sp. MBR-1]
MSSHDCTLFGTLQLKANVTRPEVEEALKPFLDWIGTTFELEMADDGIILDGAELFLHVDFAGPGGEYTLEELNAAIVRLGEIVSEPGFVEVRDYDTGSADGALVPHFVGETAADREHATVEYGIDAALTWIEPVLGHHASVQIATFIRSTFKACSENFVADEVSISASPREKTSTDGQPGDHS